MSSLAVTRQGRVAVLTLDRREHGNRLTTALAAEVAAALRAARDDAAIGACVLTGAGDVFCLGGDYQGAGPTDDGRTAFPWKLRLARGRYLHLLLMDCRADAGNGTHHQT